MHDRGRTEAERLAETPPSGWSRERIPAGRRNDAHRPRSPRLGPRRCRQPYPAQTRPTPDRGSRPARRRARPSARVPTTPRGSRSASTDSAAAPRRGREFPKPATPRPAKSNSGSKPSWVSRFLQRARLQYLVPHQVPDFDPQGEVFPGLAVVAGTIEVGQADVGLDAAWTRRKHDHSRSQINRLVDVVGDEQRGLAGASP